MQTPLKGLKILDFTRATAGPYGSLLLADLGAEIIKVENPNSDQRVHRAVLDNFVAQTYDFQIRGIGTHFLALNRNKRSIAVNMRSEKGLKILQELVNEVDVVFTNYR